MIAAKFRSEVNDFDDKFHAWIVNYPSALIIVFIDTWVILGNYKLFHVGSVQLQFVALET